MKYEVIVSGKVITTCNTREDAEYELRKAQNSFLAMVHPKDSFRIKEIDK